MRMDMSQGPFCVEIYRENAGRLSRAHYFARRAQSKCTCTLTLYGDQKQNQHMATEYGNPSFCLGSGWRAGKLSSQLATPLLTASLAALLAVSLALASTAPAFCNNIVCVPLPCLTRVPYTSALHECLTRGPPDTAKQLKRGSDCFGCLGQNKCPRAFCHESLLSWARMSF
jgi:uncharacterized protein YjhX (UPF0386 family)